MKAMPHTLLARTALLCTSAIAMAAPAYAQAAADAAPPPVNAATTADAPAKQAGGLTDIIVTARKRAENLQNIPIADTVVSQKQLQTYQITSVEKVAALAPQLIVSRNGSGNGAAIGLRGISVNATSISLEQSVATVIDGVYYSGGRSLNVGLFDLSQVELLKGPQSLFYGKNTTAGAISVTTADPTSHYSVMGRMGYEFNAKNPYMEGYVSGPITDTLSVRLAARYSDQFGALIKNISQPGTVYTHDIATGASTAHQRGTVDGDVPGEKNFTARLGIKWQPIDGLTLLLKNTYDNYHSSGPNSSAVIGYCSAKGFVQTDPTAPCGHQFVQVQNALPEDIAANIPVDNRHGGKPYLDYYEYNSTLNMTYETDKVTFSLTPAYTKSTTYWFGDFDFTDNYMNRAPALGTGGNNTGTYERQTAFSVEARAQTHLGGPINFMVGGYYQHFTQLFQQYNIYPGGQENTAAPSDLLRYLTIYKIGHLSGDTYSGFGQALWNITPTLNFTAGVRYSHELKDSYLSQPYVIPISQGSFAQTTLSQPHQGFNNTSPEATLTWKPKRNITLYGSYRTGYKSGGFSISGSISPLSTAADATFKPEKVSGFEGGIKSTLLDNQLRLNFDGFWYTYKGLQVDYFDPTTIRYLTTNAGKARTRGLELETVFAPHSLPGLQLNASGAFTDAKYTSFARAPCLGGETPAEGCNLALNAAGTAYTLQSLTGQHTPQAPKWTATFGGDYSQPIGNDLKIGLSTNVRYSSRYKTYAFAPDSAARFFQKQYATVDASLSLARQDDRWEVQLIGKNLTNHFIVTSAFDLTYTGSGTGTAAGVHSDGRTSIYDPRTVALQLTVKY